MSGVDKDPVVQYRNLGKCGLRVSVPIVGAMSFGNDGWSPWVVDEETAIPLLNAAWERGVTTIDTANVYSFGDSERIIGNWMKKFNIPREKVLILTKCFGLVGENPRTKNQSINHLADTRDYVNKSGLSRTAIFRAVDASLERLQTPYIDLLQIHRFDFNTPLEETMKALHDLVESGKVRYIGGSSMRAWQFAELQNTAEKHNWTKFVSMQNEYSLLYREEEREMIPYCNAHGIGLIPWGPLQAGTLARPLGQQTVRSESSDRKFSDADETIIKRVEEIAQKRGCTMAQVALAWIDGKVASPIVGFSSPARLEEAIITGLKLTEEESKYLEEPYVPKVVRGHA